MSSDLSRTDLEKRLDAEAEKYLRSLPEEHFMEATPQATQRKISLCSFEWIHARRPDIQAFNELLVLYPVGPSQKTGKVVPDNMVVVHSEPIEAVGHFSLEMQPVAPFWMLEYVSKGSERKDYTKNMRKYEKQLKVPYYLLFYPDNDELTLFRHTGTRYLSVIPDKAGLHVIPELEMAVGLVDGWARFWFRGEMVPLPGDIQHDLDEVRLELERIRREMKKVNERADEQSQRADTQSRRADTQSQRADTQSQRADKAERLLLEERQSRQRMEAELAKMKADFEAVRRAGEAG